MIKPALRQLTITLLATGAALLCFRWPYHSTLLSLAVFGVWHVFREYEFWFAEVRILRRRKQYPPLIVAGAFAFGVAEIALLAPRLPIDGYSALTLLYLFAIAWLAVLVAAQPNRHYLLSLPLLFAAMPLLLLAPAWFLFTNKPVAMPVKRHLNSELRKRLNMTEVPILLQVRTEERKKK